MGSRHSRRCHPIVRPPAFDSTPTYANKGQRAANQAGPEQTVFTRISMPDSVNVEPSLHPISRGRGPHCSYQLNEPGGATIMRRNPHFDFRSDGCTSGLRGSSRRRRRTHGSSDSRIVSRARVVRGRADRSLTVRSAPSIDLARRKSRALFPRIVLTAARARRSPDDFESFR